MTKNNDIVSSKAPDDFEVTEKKFTGSGIVIPARMENLDVKVISSKLEEPEKKKESYTYKIPEGYKMPKQVLVEKKEEPKQEVIKEDVVKTPKTPEELMIDTISSQISASTKKKTEENVLNDEALQSLTEHKLNLLEKQLTDLRRLVSEVQQGTIVHGLGHGGSGGGEVNLKYLDDVDITTIQDGETIVWDSFLGKFIPQAASGGELDLTSLNRSVSRLNEKFISMDNRLQNFLKQDSKFLKLEDNTAEEGTRISREPRTFIDEIPDGDTTTFVVGIDGQRGVWTLDGIPQPTVQVPRGDIIVFDLSGIGDDSKFDIYINGALLEDGKTRVDVDGQESITVHTGQIPSTLYKLYYKHTEKNGMGWIINITDN